MILRLFSRIVWVALSALGAPAWAADQGPVSLLRETVWRFDVDVIAVGPGTHGSLGTYAMTATAADPGSLLASLGGDDRWPGGELQLSAAITRRSDGEATVAFGAVVARPGRAPVRASRQFTLSEGGSQVIEIYGEGDRRLLVSLRGEQGSRPVVRRLASTGAPILLHLEIERVDGERTVPLETNDLNTFVGEPVEYSFDFGGDQERLRLVLTPVSIGGSIAQIRAQVSGQLPDAAGPVLLSRDRVFAASRGATSSVEVLAGDPPRGYRFRVTPEF